MNPVLPPRARVLLVHNYYGSAAPSGENAVFEAERDLLISRGHDVATFTRHSDEIRRRGLAGAVQGAFSTPWNFRSAQRARMAVEDFSPQVAHVHNTFPLISPAIFHAIGGRAARVLTLHNYRLFCPAAIPMRDGKVCTQCMDRRSILPALRFGCYRGSRLATVPLALGVALHRHLRTWTDQVDAFIALTEFQRERMIAAGLPPDRVHVKPNFFPGSPAVVPWRERRPYAVFAGRLTPEKGVQTAIRAWMSWGAGAPELHIVGDGPLRGDLERLAAGAGAPVRFKGQLAPNAAQAEIASARLLVLPSEWFEGFPMTLREAFAMGTPAAVSDIGPLPSIVRQGEGGVLFSPGDPASLLAVVRAVWESPGKLEKLAQGARRMFEVFYTEDANYEMLSSIYDRALATSREKSRIQ